MNIQTAAACIVLTGPNGFMGVWRFTLLLAFVDSGNNFFSVKGIKSPLQSSVEILNADPEIQNNC